MMTKMIDPRSKSSKCMSNPFYLVVILLTCLCLSFCMAPLSASINSTSSSYSISVQGSSQMTVSTSGVGIGTTSPSSKLTVVGGGNVDSLVTERLRLGIESISSDKVLSSNSMVFVDSASADITVTLPSASTYVNQMYTIKKVTSSNNVIVGTVDSSIDTKMSMSANAVSNGTPSLTVISNGSAWHTVNNNGFGGYGDLSGNLVAYYTFDETSGATVADSSGHGRSGTLEGGMTFSTNSTTGHRGRTLQFDGVDDAVNISAHGFTLAANASLSIWLYVDSLPGGRVGLFGKHASNPDDTIAIRSGDLRIEFSDGSTIDPSNALEYKVPEQQWFHLCITVDANGLMSTYLNSDPVLTSNIGSKSIRMNYMASPYGGTAPRFQGKMDEFRLYDRCLQSSEVGIDMKSGNFSLNSDASQNLLAWWTFDDTSGTSVTDSSHFARHGTLSGNTFDNASVTGKVGNALRFDGLDDVIDFSSHSLDFSPGQSLSMWLKLETSVGGHSPGLWGTGVGGHTNYYFCFTGGDANPGLRHRSNSDSPTGLFGAGSNVQEWFHLGLVKSSDNTISYYFNGDLKGTMAQNIEKFSMKAFGIGHSNTGSNPRYKGLVDDFKYYSVELTPAQMKTLAAQ